MGGRAAVGQAAVLGGVVPRRPSNFQAVWSVGLDDGKDSSLLDAWVKEQQV